MFKLKNFETKELVIFDNGKRIHSLNGYYTLNQYERMFRLAV